MPRVDSPLLRLMSDSRRFFSALLLYFLPGIMECIPAARSRFSLLRVLNLLMLLLHFRALLHSFRLADIKGDIWHLSLLSRARTTSTPTRNTPLRCGSWASFAPSLSASPSIVMSALRVGNSPLIP